MNKSTLFVFTLLTALTASSVFAASEVPKSAANNIISPIVKQLSTHLAFLSNGEKSPTQPPVCNICALCCHH